LIADVHCTEALEKADVVEAFSRQVISVTGLHVRHYHAEAFTNGSEFGPGITTMALLSESHLVVHTAPERGMLNVDLYSCRAFDAELVRGLIELHFAPDRWDYWEVLARH
jgi:S-adenosylmethionine decarboxylase